jgi:hypothetical protein
MAYSLITPVFGKDNLVFQPGISVRLGSSKPSKN